MAHRVTNEDIKKINKLYRITHNYSAVARATGFTPGTVRKYVIDGYEVSENIIKFDRPLPETFDESLFKGDNWASLCSLSDEEKEGMKELWKELEL